MLEVMSLILELGLFMLSNLIKNIFNYIFLLLTGSDMLLVNQTMSFKYMLIAKSTNKSPGVRILDLQQVRCNQDSSIQCGHMKARCDFLENAVEDLKKDCGDAVEELKVKAKSILDLENENERL